MTDKMTHIHLIEGDQTFRLTGDMIYDLFLNPAEEKLGKGRFVRHDWSLPERVKTDGKTVWNTIEALRKAPAEPAVKFPGASATKEQLEYVWNKVERAGTPTEDALKTLGGGASPNAVLRGEEGADGSIIRYPAEGADLIEPLKTSWSPASPVTLNHLESGRSANAITLYAPDSAEKTEIEVSFTNEEGKTKILYGATGKNFRLSSGSPLQVTSVSSESVQALIRTTFEEAIRNHAKIKLAVKNTVLKGVDAPIAKMATDIYLRDYKTRFHDAGVPEPILTGRIIVDDVFADVIARDGESPIPIILLSPDDAYGRQMAHVLQAVKEKGIGFDHTKHAVYIGRFSNGYGDEYGGISFRAETGGTINIRLGAEEHHFAVRKGQMWMVTTNDLQSARDYANRMIDYALSTAKDVKPILYIYFGFHYAHGCEAAFAKAIEEVLHERAETLQKAGITAQVRNPEAITAEMISSPPEAGVILALNNLWGDIVADLYPRLANSYISYDSALISNKGFCVETGAGGTAPDRIFGSVGLENTGFLCFNPGAIVFGVAKAIERAGQVEGNEQVENYGRALSKAYVEATKRGYVTSDLGWIDASGKHVTKLSPKRINADAKPQVVDTRVMLQAVKVELLKILGDSAQEAENKLRVLEKTLSLTQASQPLAASDPLRKKIEALNLDPE